MDITNEQIAAIPVSSSYVQNALMAHVTNLTAENFMLRGKILFLVDQIEWLRSQLPKEEEAAAAEPESEVNP